MACVYVLRADDEAVKIGMSSGTPDKRIGPLQTGNHKNLTLVGYAEFIDTSEAFKYERYLHDLFSKLHIRGEWFALGVIEYFKTYLGFKWSENPSPIKINQLLKIAPHIARIEFIRG